jgi:hypothetical protein
MVTMAPSAIRTRLMSTLRGAARAGVAATTVGPVRLTAGELCVGAARGEAAGRDDGRAVAVPPSHAAAAQATASTPITSAEPLIMPLVLVSSAIPSVHFDPEVTSEAMPQSLTRGSAVAPRWPVAGGRRHPYGPALAEPPDGRGLDSWRDDKSEIIKALRPLTPEDAAYGQYEGYLNVDGVAAGSTTETFAAVRLTADSWRWSDVPILIRAGKCMPVTATEIGIRFRRPPHDVFGIQPSAISSGLRFRINPEVQVGLDLIGKKPGAGWEPQPEALAFSEQPGSDMRAYDRLIGAVLSGQHWLFAREDTVEAAWSVVDPVIGQGVPLRPYARGTWGPKEADALLPTDVPWHDPA